MKIFLPIVLLFTVSFSPSGKISPEKPSLGKLKFSSCTHDCKDPEKIFSSDFKNNIYSLNFGVITNCASNDTAFIKYSNDSLWIDLSSKPEMRILHYGGKTDTIYGGVSVGCNCYFYVNMTIKNLPKKPEFLSIEGKSLGE